MTKKIKRLYRSEKDKVLGGVCGGIAEHFEVDPVLTRVIAVLLFFMSGFGFLAYFVLWIIIPKKSDIIKTKNKKNKK